MKKLLALVFALPFVVALMVVVVLTSDYDDPAAELEMCGPGGGGAVNVSSTPTSGVGKWTAEQAGNAATIIRVGAELGLPARGQTIAVMTAMGESSLRVLDHGDAAGPDSRGLFQQRDSWGTLAERMDPATSAALFYRALLKVPGWADMEPTLAAHAVQHNADAFHYEPLWDDAQELVRALTGGGPTDAQTVSLSSVVCQVQEGSFAGSGLSHVGPYSAAQLRERMRAFVAANPKDPFFHSISGDWYRLCQHFAANLSGRSSSGYATALTAWSQFVMAGVAHEADAVDGHAPPPGAWLYYEGGGPAGHVAVYMGNGQVASTDAFGRGEVGVGPASAMTSGPWHLKYLGWAAPWGEKVATVTPTAPIETVVLTGGSGDPSAARLATVNTLGCSHTGSGGDTHRGWASCEARAPRWLDYLSDRRVGIAGLQEVQGPVHRIIRTRYSGQWGVYPRAYRSDRQNPIIWRKDRYQQIAGGLLPIPYNNRTTQHVAWVLLRDATGGQVFVLNLHNTSSGGSYGDGARGEAVKRERAIVESLVRRGVPVMVAGDFNEVDRPHCAFTAAGMTSVFGRGRLDPCRAPGAAGIDQIFGANLSMARPTVDKRLWHERVNDHPVVTVSFGSRS